MVHKSLPYGGFIVCFHCWAYVEKEENEITRHLREAHDENTGRGQTLPLYKKCRIVPEQVAVDLTDQEAVDKLNNKVFNSYNTDPKTEWASINKIKGMYRHLNKPIPICRAAH